MTPRHRRTELVHGARPDPGAARGPRAGRTAWALLPAALLAAGCASPSGPATRAPVPVPGPEGRPLELEALPPWAVYTADGERATLDDVVAAMGGVDVVFVGEEHGDPLGHRVEAELLERAYRRWGDTRSVVLSLEMFERDVQLVLDEYVRGLVPEEHFLASARPWPRYRTDYRPLVEFAKAHLLPVVAANTPRRYVNMVSREGREALDRLPEASRAWLPPLPYPRPSAAYRAQWDSVMAEAMARAAGDEGAGEHGAAPPESVLQAQALWDAGMGEAVARAVDERTRALVLHYAGGFHVERGTGTPEALLHYRPGTRFVVVALRSVDDPRVFGDEDAGRGDFVVLTREQAEGG